MKLYKVEFLKYTNSMRDTVAHNTIKGLYLDVKNGLIVKECDLELIQKYGGGIKKMEFVGELYEPNDKA